MGESARVEELHITPELCAAVIVDPGELHANSHRLRSLAERLRSQLQLLEQVGDGLASAHTVPGGAVSAAPAQAALGLGVFRLRRLCVTIEHLAAALGEVAHRYEEAERNISDRFRTGLSGGYQWWRDTFGTWLPSPIDPLLYPVNRFFTAGAQAQMQALTDHPLATLASPRMRIAAIFSAGVIRYNQLRALSPIGWFRLLPDSFGAATGLHRALSPIWDPNSPGIDRAGGAALARALSGVIAPGGDVGDGAAVGARVVDAVHAGLGHRGIRMERIGPKHDDGDPTRAPVRTFADSIAVMKELEIASGAQSGELRIDRVTSAQGEHSWQVFIPGGQGFDPRDVHALLHTVSSVDSNPTPSTAMVVAALREVGVKKGEPVVMVGHSHGGITGSMLANDPRVRAEFDIPLVITAGSPIDRHDIRPDTHVVSFEHTEDFVTGLDGVEWQAKPGMTRVDRTLGESSDPETAAGVGPVHSHDFPNYIETAELADNHPDLAHTRSWLEAVIPEGEVETFRFRAEITR